MDEPEFLSLCAVDGQRSANPAPQQPPVLPYQLSEQSFRRYEQLINDVVNLYPNPVTATAVGINPNTMCCRLRDAIASVISNRWSTYINLNRLVEIRLYIKIVTTHIGVRIEPRVAKQTQTAIVIAPTPEGRCEDAILNAYALLLHNRLIANVNVRITSEQLTHITTNYDISYEHLANGTTNLF